MSEQTGEYGPLLSGDDLERIDCVGGDEAEMAAAVRTAMFHRQEAMDLRDEVERLRGLDLAALRSQLAEAVRLLTAWSDEGPRNWHVRHEQTSAFLPAAVLIKEEPHERGDARGGRVRQHRWRHRHLRGSEAGAGDVFG